MQVLAATITINPSTTYQTSTGWEVTMYAYDESPAKNTFTPSLIDKMINEAGINRIRLEVRSGVENNIDHYANFIADGSPSAPDPDYYTWRCNRYATVNDNNDPNVINPSGFQWTQLDSIIDRIVTPARQAMQARGESLYINLNYVSFAGQMTGANCPQGLQYHHDDSAQEYAEFILATFQHIQQKYGWVPNAVEIILEPDNTAYWRGKQIGDAILATQAKLSAAGFNNIDFIAPSNTDMTNALTYFDDLKNQVPSAVQYIDELAYHRYSGVSTNSLQNIANRVTQNNIKGGAMLEWWSSGNTYSVLHEDLTTGRNSAWQHGVIATAPNVAEPAVYEINDNNVNNPILTMSHFTKKNSLYYRHIRFGAVRVGATSNDANFNVVAYRNIDGKYAVAGYNHNGQGQISVVGLPAGTYGFMYSAMYIDSEFHKTLPDVTITAGQTVNFNLPLPATFVIYSKTAAAPDTTAPTQVTGLTSNTITSNQISLSWSAATDNVGVSGYRIFRNAVQIGTSSTPTYTDTGLSPSTLYNYRVAAYDSAGNVGTQSSQISVTTTAAVDTTAPSQVTGLTTSVISSSQINLAWNTATDNIAIASYLIYRNNILIANTTSTSYSNTGLSPSTTYQYKISAVDTSGNKGTNSSTASATTPAATDTTPPTQVTGLSATPVSTSQINLQWNSASDNVGVTGYKIYRNNIFITTTNSNTYSDSGLIANTTYSYRVNAYDGAGNNGLNSTQTSATTSANQPIILEGDINQDNIVNTLDLLIVTADFGKTTGFNSKVDAMPPFNSIDLFDVMVVIRNWGRTISTSDSNPPTQVIGLSASPTSSSQINLAWSTATDNVAVTGYRIYRNNVQIATSTSTSYSDSGLSASTTYQYKVNAFDSAGNNGLNSTTVSATTQSSGGGTPQTQRLLQRNNLVYRGKFYLPSYDNVATWLTYSNRALGVSEDGTSIYAGCQGTGIAKVSIPAIGGTGTIQDRCRAVPNVQAIHPDTTAPAIVAGIMEWQGRLITSAYTGYDASSAATKSHWGGTTIAGATGPVTVGTYNPGFVAGHMTIIPPEWRSLLGGPALTGQCCLSIIGRTSSGPTASVFNPADVGVTNPVPATMLVGYPHSNTNPIIGTYDNLGPLYGMGTESGGIAFPQGTRSVLFIEKAGTVACYGEGTNNPAQHGQPVPGWTNVFYCYDPIYPSVKGSHGYPYLFVIGAYDANELLAVKQGIKQPWQVVPYGVWNLTEIDSSGSATIIAATFNHVTNMIYVRPDTRGNTPEIHVYEII